MIGSPPQRPPTRRAWWHAPTPWSPITAFPNLCGRSAWLRAHAASPWCSTPTGRRRRPTSCSGLPPTWCFPPSACAPPPVSTTSVRRSPRLPPRHRLFSPSPRARETCSGARAPRCAGARSLRSRRSTRWAPATCSTARSRSRSRKAATWSRRCGSPRRRPASNARAWAAVWRPRAAPRSRPCWRRAKARLPAKASGPALRFEFQLRENSLLDTPQKHREAKRSFYRARRDYIYFPCRVCPDGRHRPQDSRSSAAGCLPLGGRDRQLGGPILDAMLEAYPTAGGRWGHSAAGRAGRSGQDRARCHRLRLDRDRRPFAAMARPIRRRGRRHARGDGVLPHGRRCRLHVARGRVRHRRLRFVLQAADRGGAAQERHLALRHGEDQGDNGAADSVRRDVKASASRFSTAMRCIAPRADFVKLRRPSPRLLNGQPRKWPESLRALRCADVLLETDKALFRHRKEYVATEFRASML